MDEIKRLTEDEFVVNSILKLRVEPYKGIHTVISNMNEGFRGYFPGKDPVAHVNDMEKRGLIEGHFSKKGRTIYLKGEMPNRFAAASKERAAATIAKVVGGATPNVISRKVKEKIASKRLSKLSNAELDNILTR